MFMKPAQKPQPATTCKDLNLLVEIGMISCAQKQIFISRREESFIECDPILQTYSRAFGVRRGCSTARPRVRAVPLASPCMNWAEMKANSSGMNARIVTQPKPAL